MDAWILVLFGCGIVLTVGVAILYAAIAVSPTSVPAGMDPASVRPTSIALAVAAAAVCLLQAGALAGMVTGRDWGRTLATVTCVAYALTCLGIPVSILVLNSIWRRRDPPASAPRAQV